MNKRLYTALAAFAALGVVASFVLHGKPLLVVLILFAYFAVRTVIADRVRAQSESERRVSEPNAAFQSETPDSDSESEAERH
jgi:uncharacterized membrane protein